MVSPPPGAFFLRSFFRFLGLLCVIAIRSRSDCPQDSSETRELVDFFVFEARRVCVRTGENTYPFLSISEETSGAAARCSFRSCFLFLRRFTGVPDSLSSSNFSSLRCASCCLTLFFPVALAINSADCRDALVAYRIPSFEGSSWGMSSTGAQRGECLRALASAIEADKEV